MGVIIAIALQAPAPRRGNDEQRVGRSMRWADVYVCMLADGVALRNRCPQGQA